MEIQIFQVDPIGTNCYVVSENGEAFIVDPGGNSDVIIDHAKKFKVRYILLTHSHYDHIGALSDVAKAFPEALVGIHKVEKDNLYSPEKNFSLGFGLDFSYSGEVQLELFDGQNLQFGGTNIKVIHTPGHTQGGVCFHINDLLFSGDTLFKSSVGRTDLPGGDAIDLIKNIREKLYTLSGKTVVHPGHEGTTTIGWERTRNPFVKL